MRMPLAYGMRDRRRPRLATQLALHTTPFRKLHFIDPVVYHWVQREGSRSLRERAGFIADPITYANRMDRTTARQRLGLPTDRSLIFSIGMQEERKGVDRLIAAAKVWKPDRAASIVLAGAMSESIRQMLNASPELVDNGRLIVLDRYLQGDEFDACFAAADLIVAPYRPHPQPSAIVLQAAAAERMVLASDHTWFKYMVPQFQLGDLCDTEEPATFAEAMSAALIKGSEYQLSDVARRLVEFHRPENFVRQWRAGLAALSGSAVEAPSKTWEWVVNGAGS